MSTTLTVEETALEKLSIIDKFNFGHNRLKSPATLEQIFTQLVETIKPVFDAHKHVISDINVSIYDKDTIVANKVNICWWQLRSPSGVPMSTYFILLNPYIGSSYTPMTSDNINQLLLNGKTSGGWYLLNQIDCLQDFISSTGTDDQINLFFSTILTRVIASIFGDHSKDYSFNAHYTLQFIDKLQNITKDIDALISTIQIKASSKMLDIGGTSYIYADDATIMTYYSNSTLEEFTINNVQEIVNSKYILKSADIASFLKNEVQQKQQCNVKFFYVHENFKAPKLRSLTPFEFVDAVYSVTSQLLGKFKINYTDGTYIEISPSCQAIPIVKTQTNIFFLVMLYSNSYLNKAIESVDADNVKLIYSLKGPVIKQAEHLL